MKKRNKLPKNAYLGSQSRILKVSVSEGVVSVSNGLVSVSDSEAETPSLVTVKPLHREVFNFSKFCEVSILQISWDI